MRPDTITVDSEEHAEVTATAATLTVTIEGSSVFLGNEAITKAREVGALVSTLVALEVPQEQIHVIDVRVGSEGFLGLKSSSCRYTISIRDLATARIPAVVSAIAAQKGAELVSMHWRFGCLDARVSELRQKCLATSKETGETTAAALGLRIMGVYRHSEEVIRPDHSQTFSSRRPEVYARAALASISSSEDTGPSLSFVGRLSLATQTHYKVERVDGHRS
jgi:hypothetical protein